MGSRQHSILSRLVIAHAVTRARGCRRAARAGFSLSEQECFLLRRALDGTTERCRICVLASWWPPFLIPGMPSSCRCSLGLSWCWFLQQSQQLKQCSHGPSEHTMHLWVADPWWLLFAGEFARCAAPGANQRQPLWRHALACLHLARAGCRRSEVAIVLQEMRWARDSTAYCQDW